MILNKIIKILDENLKISIFLIFFLPFQILIINNIEVISAHDLYISLKFTLLLCLLFYLFQFLSFAKKFEFEYLINFIIIINIFLNFIIFENGFVKFKYFILIQFLIISFYFYFYKRFNFIYKKIYKFVKLTSFILICIILSKILIQEKINNEIFFKNNYFKDLNLKNKIDFYYIIPDGLQAFDELKKNKNYKNNNFEEELKKNNLEPLKSLSNYPTTFASIPSILNGSIFKEDVQVSEKKFYNLNANSYSIQMFLKNNYEIIWYENTWAGTKCKNTKLTCPQKKNFINFIDNEIILNYFKIININAYWTDKFYIYFKIKREYHLDHLANILNKKKYTKPVFVFAHLLLPHQPFRVDEKCQPIYLNNSLSPNWDESKYFIQLECLKKQIINFNNFIKSKNRPYVLIIGSDTGWTFDDKLNPTTNINTRWRYEMFKNNVIISSKYVCFNKNKTITNVEVLLFAIHCSENKPLPIVETSLFDTYYAKTGHKDSARVIKRDFVK